MGKKSGYIWVISMMLVVLVVDAYYQIESSPVPIWQTEWFLWRMLAILLILIGIGFYNYLKAKDRTKKELDEFKAKMVEEQENQWKVIAGELHDSIGQNLSAINIFLQQSIRTGDSEKLENASALVVETVDEVRRISQRLYPKQIERLGLTISLEALTERISAAAGIRFNTNIESIDNILTRENEVQYFRIIQEILNNTIKHSNAKNVTLNIRRSVMFIVTEIEDDGVGFELSNPAILGFGLINIEERISMIKGVYEFKSEKDKGTKFKITVPIKQH
jgi:two-component system, sensor histidine kinase LadS